MQFVDLRSQYLENKDRIQERINRVLEHGQYILGPEVQELEEKLAAYVGVKHCLTCASGTDALLMSLMAKGIGAGDLVFTTPFTFIATAEVIALLGATPVFVDIETDTFNIDPIKLELAIDAVSRRDAKIYPIPRAVIEGKATRARGIIAVDLFGVPCDYSKINSLAQKNDLFVIEDAAQSFGAKRSGQAAGSLAEIGCTSFYPAKPLGCYGDGGAIFTDQTELYEILRSVRVHGQGQSRYEHVRLGLAGRLDTIQAAVLLAKLETFSSEVRQREQIAQMYNREISKREKLQFVRVPRHASFVESAWAQYSILVRMPLGRDRLAQALAKAKIPTMIYYPKPLHRQSVFSGLGYQAEDFEGACAVSEQILSLPMHPFLNEEEIDQVVNQMCEEA